MTAPDPEGDGAARAMAAALADAGLRGPEVGYINAHGTSTPYNDKFETLAIKRVFGDHARRLAVSSTKSMTGHMLGAAGGGEAIATPLARPHRVLPPTINYETLDPPGDLDYLPNHAPKPRVRAGGADRGPSPRALRARARAAAAPAARSRRGPVRRARARIDPRDGARGVAGRDLPGGRAGRRASRDRAHDRVVA